MIKAHHLGFPRIGAKRELKWAVENYWKGAITQSDLQKEGQRIRYDNWKRQINAHHDLLSVGDFSWYDHVLDTATLLGVIPTRFLTESSKVDDLNTYFRMARGRAPQCADTPALEMTKWFDTNYHYIVPELSPQQIFQVHSNKLFNEILEAQQFKQTVKPILLGPLTFLWLSKAKQIDFNKLDLLDQLLVVYKEILVKLRDLNIEWVQIDEPILVLDLPAEWQKAFIKAYDYLKINNLNLLLTTYFGNLADNRQLALQLPTAGLHIDAVRAKDELPTIVKHFAECKDDDIKNRILSVGIIDGRNIWRNDLRKSLNILKPIYDQLPNRLWIGSSCSLLHCPVDLDHENLLDAELKNWLAFATQKLNEISLIKSALEKGEFAIADALALNEKAVQSRKTSARIHNSLVKNRCQQVTPAMTLRNKSYYFRRAVQEAVFNLPLFPTTTIGSFPQTKEIRETRHAYKSQQMKTAEYREKMRHHIAHAIRKQLELGIDVLVHGEAERNDMVEYFGEMLEGFTFTANGWVQSYGSRCVKPPIIFGDISRAQPMTIEWASYAQSLTDKPVKGMLTGPITILCWSFVRDDQPRFETAQQIALALRDEVTDLVKAGIEIIQIDEPAIREGLPLRQKDWQAYLRQAVHCFRLASSGVADNIQIHTHMCYSEFNDIIEAIADLDADVITIETSRSDMELLQAFEKFNYPNDIGPGVYDIHSPRIPNSDEIIQLIEKAANYIPIRQLWINPDCGLKTREWGEVEAALKNMVLAASILREKFSTESLK